MNAAWIVVAFLGCLTASTLFTVMTFTMIDVRRTIMTVLDRLETLGDRNHAAMLKTLEAASENHRMLVELQRRFRLSEGDEPGN